MNPDYIGAYALPPGEDMTVEILSVGTEKVTVSGGKKEVHTVAKLRGQKPWILNATNQKSIARLHGPYIEDWAGKKVTLYASTAKLAGDTVECLRVRGEIAQVNKPGISEARLKAAIASIKAGDFTAAKLRDKFFLTLEQDDFVDAELAAPAQAENKGAIDA